MALEDKENAEQTEKLADMKFLAKMSNKMSTPINVILGNNDMILRGTRESHTAAYAIGIQAAGKSLSLAVSNIIELMNLDNGTLKLEDAPYSTISLLQDVMSYAEYNAEKKNLEFHLEIDEALPQELSGDTVRLAQVLSNLLSNAIKHTQKGFVGLSIGWQQSEKKEGAAGSGTLTVQVKDSGIGIEKQAVEQIMESHHNLLNQSACSAKRSGLGLPVVVRLLDLMGSRLQVESEYGKGSTFSFGIEQKVMDSNPIGSLENSDNSHVLPQSAGDDEFVAPEARILVADDNVMNLDLFRGMLRKAKVQIETAFNGEEALKLLRLKKYHLVFLDHVMPAMDGLETLEKIRAEELCPGVPVIVLTANMIPDARKLYQEKGFDDYLPKPISTRQLNILVKKYLPKELVQEKKEPEPEPEKPTEKPDMPTELPNTGPAEIALAVIVVVAIVAGIVYWQKTHKAVKRATKKAKGRK